MNKPSGSPESSLQLLSARVDELRLDLQQRSPQRTASNTGAHYVEHSGNDGAFEFNFWDAPAVLTYPEGKVYDRASGDELPVAFQALILYYFHTADGTPLSDRWIAFSELQNGRFYTQAFQGYTGNKLGSILADDLAAFRMAALAVGGESQGMGDAGFVFQLLPRVRMLVLAWLGDEDFPSSYQILFDASVNHYLPTDACAIAGSMLTGKLIRASQI